ncbi:MAG: hypothetical protein JWM27_4245 [Gemmatimonadetes bacterium]|nr:hypothetical protein [Gemmatimonadota bacterium]
MGAPMNCVTCFSTSVHALSWWKDFPPCCSNPVVSGFGGRSEITMFSMIHCPVKLFPCLHATSQTRWMTASPRDPSPGALSGEAPGLTSSIPTRAPEDSAGRAPRSMPATARLPMVR